MSLKIPLVFHFNQHISEHALLASQVCYRGLLRVLLNHPEARFNLHISGTLIHALAWLDPEPLDLIREGIARGQFELLGSTYAQNIPYATNDRDNEAQISLHREVLSEFFNVSPTTFWNPERCWRQSLVPLIASAGYHTTLVESHILESSGAGDRIVYQTRSGGNALKIIRDEERLIDLINFAAWFGDPSPVISFLKSAHTNGATCLAYAEDAEAMGLWGFYKGVDPNQTWAQLDRLLTELTGCGEIETVLLQESPAPAAEVTPIQDGSASWMDASLRNPDLPYHEEGYRDWFDFIHRSPKISHFNRFFDSIRERIFQPPQSVQPGPNSLHRLAKHTYLAHQYEFGCIGIGHEVYRGWKGAQASLVLNQASLWALERQPFLKEYDINDDDIPEACLSDGKQLIITTHQGGRLLYWVDLDQGRVRIGSPLAVGRSPHNSDSAYPKPVMHPRYDILPITLMMPTTLQKEAPPTRMAPFMDPWIWDQVSEPFHLAVREIHLDGEDNYLPSQVRGFADEILVDGELIIAPSHPFTSYLDHRSIVYTANLGPDLFLEKRLRLIRAGVQVDYAWSNTGSTPVIIHHTIRSEINMDVQALLSHGQAALHFVEVNGGPGLHNSISGEILALKSSFKPERYLQEEALIARILGAQLTMQIRPGVFQKYSLTLTFII